MEEKFISAWTACREQALTLGVRMRPVEPETAMANAHRIMTGKRLSDGFNELQKLGKLKLSLESLVVDKRYTQLFTDEEANEALMRLVEAGYRFS